MVLYISFQFTEIDNTHLLHCCRQAVMLFSERRYAKIHALVMKWPDIWDDGQLNYHNYMRCCLNPKYRATSTLRIILPFRK